MGKPGGAQGPSPISQVGAGSKNGHRARQTLFNVRYSGPQGDGTLRVVLRWPAEQWFQVETADTLGRSRWSLEFADGQTLLIDHRQKIYCRGADDLDLGEVTLSVLPVRTLPRVLEGRLPVAEDIASLEDGSVELTDASGRRWVVRVAAGVLQAWTLFVDEQPALWWTRQSKGGILSHRDGSQFRWRTVVEEPVPSSLDVLSPPAEYRPVPCDEYDVPQLRQDQPAPPGAGPPG